MTWLSVSGLSLMLLACQGGCGGLTSPATRDAGGASAASGAVPLREWWRTAPCDGRVEADLYRGLAQSELVRTLGAPVHERAFTMGEAQDEFRIELQNRYPLTVAGNQQVEIREFTWAKPGCQLTIWLHRMQASWRALDAALWREGVEF